MDTEDSRQNASGGTMDQLLSKLSSSTYVPSQDEVREGVKWLRENPTVAAGVVVGLTSLSLARYYDNLEQEELLVQDQDAQEQTRQSPPTQDEIARSVSFIQLGLANVHVHGSTDQLTQTSSSAATTDTTPGSSVGSSPGLRSHASSLFSRLHMLHEEDSHMPHLFPPHQEELEDHESSPSNARTQDAQSNEDKDDNADWGWFVPT